MNRNNFLKGLDELRAIAALAVVIHHIELLKQSNINSSLDSVYSFANNSYTFHFVMSIGKYAVLFFFILSGFLITHLMIQEYKRHNSFDFKSFYMRRILRIWPLYYIIMTISFFIIPFLCNQISFFREHPNSWYYRVINTDFDSIGLWLTNWGFLSNHTLRDYGMIVGSSQSWSVSIEEQFYLLWPILLLIFFKKRPILCISATIITLIIFNRFFRDNTPYFIQFFEFLFLGGLGALLYHTPYFTKISKFIDKKSFYFVNLFIIIFFSTIPIFRSYTQYVIISIFFLSFIILTVNNRYCFRSNFLSKIGKISYGIYMYHTFVMFLVFAFVKWLNNSILLIASDEMKMVVAFSFQYVLSIGGALVISYLSYYYIEKRFLIIKTKKYSR